MKSKNRIEQALERLMARLQSFGEAAFPVEQGDGLDRIRSLEERKMVIKFMREVYHQGMSESVWAAKHPEEYARILQIAGTVPKSG